MDLRESVKAWRDGYQACELAKHLTANPYEPTTRLWSVWRKGWHAADRDAQIARD